MLGRLWQAFSPARLSLDLSFEEEQVSPVTPKSLSVVPKELQRFADVFGVDLRKQRELVPLFSYALFERPLPQGWRVYRAEDGREYFSNKYTGVSSWKSPIDVVLSSFLHSLQDQDPLKALVAAIYARAERQAEELGNWFGPIEASETGGEYYYNKLSRSSCWLHPATDAVWEAQQFLNFARLFYSAEVDAQLQSVISEISEQLVALVKTKEPQSEFKEKISARKARVDAEGVVYVRDVSLALADSPTPPSLAPSAITFRADSLQDQFNRSMEIASQISMTPTPVPGDTEADQPPAPTPRTALSVPPLPETPRKSLVFGTSEIVELVSPKIPDTPRKFDLVSETVVLESDAPADLPRRLSSTPPFHAFRHPEKISDDEPSTTGTSVDAPPERPTEQPVATALNGNFSSPSRVGKILPATSANCVFFSMAAPRSRDLYDAESPLHSSPRFGTNYRNYSN